jgi:hypothetical protein
VVITNNNSSSLVVFHVKGLPCRQLSTSSKVTNYFVVNCHVRTFVIIAKELISEQAKQATQSSSHLLIAQR